MAGNNKKRIPEVAISEFKAKCLLSTGASGQDENSFADNQTRQAYSGSYPCIA